MTETFSRRALVTGASSGIGLAVVRKLLAEGWKVVGVSRRPAPVEHERFDWWRFDLADLDSLPTKLGALLDAHPDLDAAVLAAGAGRFGSLETFSPRQMRELVDLDLLSPMLVARTLLPGWKKKKRGDLVFIGSEAALAGKRQGTVYCAAKAGLRGFAQALRDECGKSGIRVAVLQPGMVGTPFFDDLDFQPGDAPEHAIEPETVADAVAWTLASPPETVIDEIVLSPRVKVVQKS
ncbi:MAG: SDR family oxidoreductase [Acidobacteriota bacterium]